MLTCCTDSINGNSTYVVCIFYDYIYGLIIIPENLSNDSSTTAGMAQQPTIAKSPEVSNEDSSSLSIVEPQSCSGPDTPRNPPVFDFHSATCASSIMNGTRIHCCLWLNSHTVHLLYLILTFQLHAWAIILIIIHFASISESSSG